VVNYWAIAVVNYWVDEHSVELAAAGIEEPRDDLAVLHVNVERMDGKVRTVRRAADR
jgi:hypothetical protein